MRITKNRIQTIIAEEYARVLLEASGYNPTSSRINFLVEEFKTKDVDEGIIGKLFGKKSIDLDSAKKKVSYDLMTLRNDLAKKLKSSEEKIVGSEALAAAESAIALGLAKEFSKIGQLKAARTMQEFIKDQSSVYPLIKDMFQTGAEPMKSRGKGPGYGIGRPSSAGGPFLESKQILKKLALEITAKSLIREHNSKVTNKKVLNLINNDLVPLNEGIFDVFKTTDSMIQKFYKDSIKDLEAAGSTQPEYDVMLAFTSLNPTKYDIELFGPELSQAEPPGPAPSKTTNTLYKAKAPPVKSMVGFKNFPTEDSAVLFLRKLAKNVRKFAEVMVDVENGDIVNFTQLKNSLQSKGTDFYDLPGLANNPEAIDFLQDPKNYQAIAADTIRILERKNLRKKLV